jgi:hypothetical protein
MSAAKLPAAETDTVLTRRRVFAGAGAAGALAAVAGVLPPADNAAAPVSTEPPAPPEQGGGYRVTQHVLRYYQTTRL